jgi:glycosyltransferase involved in cell wall biosynthesis
MTEFAPLPEKPLVSVIIPSYNSRAWIGKALDSLFEQSYTNLEIIVVDDGSTDGTGKYLEENYKEKINYIYQANGGPGRARNNGLQHATGQLISFLDADDWLLPEKVARQVKYLQNHPEVAVVYCDLWIAYDDNPEVLLPHPYIKPFKFSGNLLPYLVNQSGIVIHAPLVRNECFKSVGDFNESVNYYEDWDLWLRMAGTGFLFGYIDKKDVVYRSRRGSLTKSNYKMHISRHRICAHAKQVIPTERLQAALTQNPNAASFEFAVARALFEKREYKAGFRQFLTSLKARHPRRILFTLFSLLYVLLLPILGYLRLERLITETINLLQKFRKSF